MSILEHEVTVIGSRGRRRCRALFDSGASYSIIRRDIAERIGRVDLLPVPEDWIFETAKAGNYVQASGALRLDFRFDDSEAHFSDEFVVFDELSEELIVGAKTMQAWKITLDFDEERVNYRKTAQRLRI
ncbi:MAG TPA: retropepsin-like aspartic protease [Spirochaetia bacterium]|nr:retropepsin-like aspartic protease [Spirochaetia bacterium]